MISKHSFNSVSQSSLSVAEDLTDTTIAREFLYDIFYDAELTMDTPLAPYVATMLVSIVLHEESYSSNGDKGSIARMLHPRSKSFNGYLLKRSEDIYRILSSSILGHNEKLANTAIEHCTSITQVNELIISQCTSKDNTKLGTDSIKDGTYWAYLWETVSQSILDKLQEDVKYKRWLLLALS